MVPKTLAVLLQNANICEKLNECFKTHFDDLSGREKHPSLFERPFTVKVKEMKNVALT